MAPTPVPPTHVRLTTDDYFRSCPVTVRTMAFTRFLPVIASALGRGRLLRRSRWVDHRADLPALTVRAYGPVPYQVDGDHLGDADVLEFRHEPEVLDLVLP